MTHRPATTTPPGRPGPDAAAAAAGHPGGISAGHPGGPSAGHPGGPSDGGPAGHPGGTSDGRPPVQPGEHPRGAGAARLDFGRRPMLVFWEMTRACGLACRHCRADATLRALPGELTTAEGKDLVDQVAAFGRPHPVLVLTGGDCLMRPDLFEIVAHATASGVPTALAPSVTPLLDAAMVARIAGSGVKAVSVSLDGATSALHDGVRGVPGHFGQTLAAVRDLVAAGLTVQVNTTVMRAGVEQLADTAAIVAGLGAHIWEVFFLVQTGRGTDAGALTPHEHEQVCHVLFDASHYGFVVRTVEAPFFRRITQARLAGGPAPTDDGLYARLAPQLVQRLGPPRGAPRARTTGTRDGKGIVFVGYDGTITPAGFLPVPLGQVREQGLAEVYRENPLLLDIRAQRFSGACGTCTHADLCGGSRARAYAATGDPLASDPACVLALGG